MRYIRLLRENPDFARLYLSSLVSFAGDWFLTVALLDLVLEMTGSATLASLMIVAQSMPAVLATPLAGHLIDSWSRKKLMISMDLVAMLAALLPLFAVNPSLLAFGYVGMILIAICSGIFQPAASAVVPNLVPPEDLSKASVLFGSTWGSMLVIGAAIGGFVTMGLGRNAAFLIDAATFLVSALLLIGIRTPMEEKRDEAFVRPGLVESFRQAFRYAGDHPKALALVTAKGGYGFAGGAVAMLSVFGREVFVAGAVGIGLLFAARGLGALLGPFIIEVIVKNDSQRYRSVPFSAAIFGLGYCALALSPSLKIGLAAVVIAHLGGGAVWLTSTYGIQHEVPDFVRGRFFAVDFGMVTLTMGISSTLAGLLADWLGVVTGTIVVSSLSVVFAIVWGSLTWRLWGRDSIAE